MVALCFLPKWKERTWHCKKLFTCLLLCTHKPFTGCFATKILLTGENSSFLLLANPFKTAVLALQTNTIISQHTNMQVNNYKWSVIDYSIDCYWLFTSATSLILTKPLWSFWIPFFNLHVSPPPLPHPPGLPHAFLAACWKNSSRDPAACPDTELESASHPPPPTPALAWIPGESLESGLGSGSFGFKSWFCLSLAHDSRQITFLSLGFLPVNKGLLWFDCL